VSWSYSGDPSATPLDQTRFEIQDTDSSAPLLQDEEISFAIETEAPDLTPGQLYAAAARCCEVLSRRFAMQADQTVGDTETAYAKMAVTYAERAAELRAKAQGAHSPSAGGITHTGKRIARSDPDRIQPLFRRGEFNNPYVGGDRGCPPRP
jgi:hypothetical protein